MANKNNQSQQSKKKASIEYISKKIPEFEDLPYKGRSYEVMVPDSLDLERRAALAINGLTGPTDPQADYEIYWLVFFNANPPWMQHDPDDAVQSKFLQSLPLMRLISGSDLNKHVERRWMEVLHLMQGADGLLYYPVVGRPWFRLPSSFGPFGPAPAGGQYTLPMSNGCFLGAITLYYMLSKNKLWREVGKKVVQGLHRLVVNQGSYAYFTKWRYAPGETPDLSAKPEPMFGNQAGWVVQGLVQFYRATGYEPARNLAGKLSRYLTGYSNLFNNQGHFLGHFDTHTFCLLGLLEYALVVGDQKLMEFVQQGYEYGKANGEPLLGYFPEVLSSKYLQTSESCGLADMIALGLKLTQAGVGDYLDDIDRWVRNQFAENQLLESDWIYRIGEDLSPCVIDETYQTSDHVPERNIGAFAGWPSPNDWWVKEWQAMPQQRTDPRGVTLRPGIMHCGTGNGTRAIYYVWENILTYTNGKLQINLLLNRASPWADLNSYIPWEGKVDVNIKVPCDLSIRIPEWVSPGEVHCKVQDVNRPLSFDGRYAKVGEVKPNDKVSLIFPIKERSHVIWVEKRRYSIVRKGNDVVSIDPPGRYHPLYQRSHYRKDKVRWQKVKRFVTENPIYW